MKKLMSIILLLCLFNLSHAQEVSKTLLSEVGEFVVINRDGYTSINNYRRHSLVNKIVLKKEVIMSAVLNMEEIDKKDKTNKGTSEYITYVTITTSENRSYSPGDPSTNISKVYSLGFYEFSEADAFVNQLMEICLR